MRKKSNTVVPRTGQCVFCESIAWLSGYEAIKIGRMRSIIEKWKCFSDTTHDNNICIMDIVD